MLDIRDFREKYDKYSNIPSFMGDIKYINMIESVYNDKEKIEEETNKLIVSMLDCIWSLEHENDELLNKNDDLRTKLEGSV